jgi:hypothetical protein
MKRPKLSRGDLWHCHQVTEKTPPVDARNIATVLEFEPVKGIDAESLTPKVIDNSIVDKIVREGFIEKIFGKSGR